MMAWDIWDRDPQNIPPSVFISCPLCKGTGRGLGEHTHETCPLCRGCGEIEEVEADYARSFGDPEDYWGVFEEDEELTN